MKKKTNKRKGLLESYFHSITPPYSSKDLHAIAITLLVLIGAYFIFSPAFANKGNFSNVSATLKKDTATFNFTYSSTHPNYKIDIATSSDMKQNLQRNFAKGSYSPVVVSNPQNIYSSYVCGATLYWIVKATDERSSKALDSSVQSTVVDCSVAPSPTLTSLPPTITPTAMPTATPSLSCSTGTPQIKPATVSLQGADGTWCSDSDGNGNNATAGTCIDSCSSTGDYCQADGTNRDGYCTGTWNGSSWNKVHCEFGGYVCSSFGKTCSAGACQ